MRKTKKETQTIKYVSRGMELLMTVQLKKDTVWLNQAQMAKLFGKGRTTIAEHISNVFKEKELEEKSVCRDFRHTAADGKTYKAQYYNLDVIISVGYSIQVLKKRLHLHY